MVLKAIGLALAYKDIATRNITVNITYMIYYMPLVKYCGIDQYSSSSIIEDLASISVDMNNLKSHVFEELMFCLRE